MTQSPIPAETTSCQVCGFSPTVPFFEVSDVPVLCNVLWPTAEDARAAPRGDICLTFCRRCGMISNRKYDAGLVDYSPAYENSLHYSPLFQSYAASLAHRLIETYEIRRKTVIEIGSGKGDFLSLLCEAGDNAGVGYDPSYDGEASGRHELSRMRFIPSLYGDGDQLDGDLVCCRHVLEHVQSPRVLVNNLARVLAHRKTVVYFEVPDAAHMLSAGAVYDVIYEHASYFTAPALRRLFADAHFDIRVVEAAFGGQYLYLEGFSAGSAESSEGDSEEIALLAEMVAWFEGTFRRAITGWARHLEQLHAEGRQVAVWGAGSKGVTFLNVVPGGNQVTHVVDVNPRKHGRFVPVSGQRVVAPEALSLAPPDTVVVMNPLYEDEVRGRLRSIGVAADVVGA